jgi:hypothetical protein
MTEPRIVPSQSNAPVVIRIILVLLCLPPAVIGLLGVMTAAAAFVEEGFQMPADRMWVEFFAAGGAVLVVLPAIVTGAVLRYARWRRAPSASLGLAITVVSTIVTSAGILQATVMPGDTESNILLTMLSVVGVVVGAVPPFMHWWNSRIHA